MQRRSFVVRRFGLGSLAQWGFITGALVACFPAFVCSWVFFALLQGLRGLLLSWQDVGFEVLGQRIGFNLLEMLSLEDLVQTLNGVTGFGVFGILMVALLMALALGVFGAIVLALLGLFYNTTGRLQVEVEPVDANVQTH